MTSGKPNDLERISSSTRAIWTLVTIAVSAVTAIASAAIYLHVLLGEFSALQAQVLQISQQLKRVSPTTRREVDHWNGTEDQKCEPGSVMVGARIGANLNGTIFCTKIQPAID
jgi:hypothetical protein